MAESVSKHSFKLVLSRKKGKDLVANQFSQLRFVGRNVLLSYCTNGLQLLWFKVYSRSFTLASEKSASSRTSATVIAEKNKPLTVTLNHVIFEPTAANFVLAWLYM